MRSANILVGQLRARDEGLKMGDMTELRGLGNIAGGMLSIPKANRI